MKNAENAPVVALTQLNLQPKQLLASQPLTLQASQSSSANLSVNRGLTALRTDATS